MDELKNTITYYNSNSDKYISNTLELEMDSLYDPFLKYINVGSKLLDAGCGPGRDTKNFLNKGFSVVSFDASIEMVKKATEVTEMPILLLNFENIEFKNEFDGIWACASLLHIPKSKIKNVLTRLSNALRVNGVFYMSFKYGVDEIFRNGRLFSNYTEDTFSELISNYPEFEIIKIWKTTDIRPSRDNENWLNIILRKTI